jgi:NADH-quinone oxidoreductase subunit J
MIADAILFWFLALVTLGAALTVVFITNPVFSALSLAMTMVGIAALFVTLGAYFLAGVQLIVYAGAVMVLFVMVLMLFDLKAELKAFSRGAVTGFLKVAAVGLLAGLIAGVVSLNTNVTEGQTVAINDDSTRQLGVQLFSQYLFGFEALGVLLLVVAVGAVALARTKGGTHARE